MKFHTTLLLAGKTATGFQVPPEVVASFDAGRKPPVLVTIGGHTYRSTVASRKGTFLVGVSAENRAAAGVAAGDDVDIELELDTEPRVVTVPEDFARALEANTAAKKRWEALSYSAQLGHVQPIETAKAEETRQRRIAKSVAELAKS